MTIEFSNQEVRKHHGRGGWPSDLTLVAEEGTEGVEVTVSDASSAKNGFWKRMDPWGFAFFDRVRTTTGKTPRLKFSVRSPNRKEKRQYEALKRRVSYLAAANDLEIALLKERVRDPLYGWKDLTNRPHIEIVRSDFPIHGDDDTPGRLEKDFQTWLFGRGLHSDSDIDIRRTNERLALFGRDFVYIGKLKSVKDQDGYKVEREFPTGVFREEVKEANRILPTEFVDLVTLNRYGELAVIEIKFDDPKLEVIPQVLNYALFFHSYRTKLTPLLDKKLACATEGRNLVTYLVSNTTVRGKLERFPVITR